MKESDNGKCFEETEDEEEEMVGVEGVALLMRLRGQGGLLWNGDQWAKELVWQVWSNHEKAGGLQSQQNKVKMKKPTENTDWIFREGKGG